MKRFVGSIFCLITVFLLGSGFLFGSVTALSNNKWSEDLSKISIEDEQLEVDDADSDESLSLHGKQFPQVKKWTDNLLNLVPYSLNFQLKYHFHSYSQLLCSGPCSHVNLVPVWLKNRRILI